MSGRFEIPELKELWNSKPADPASANVEWEWIEGVLAKLGLAVVVIEAPIPDPHTSYWPAVTTLTQKLSAAGLGEFDSFKWGGSCRWFFLCPSDRLSESLQLLKRELQSMNPAPPLKIGSADAGARVWRTFHPGITEKL